MNRVDVLAGRTRHFDGVTGEVLRGEPDARLQALTAETRTVADTPIAGVAFVLQTIEYFRAAEGLPPGLSGVRAMARDTALCQFVVRDEQPFAIEDIAERSDVPDHLYTRFGIRSYLGHPLRLDDQVLGALCVFDTRRRTFDDDTRDRMSALAQRVEARLSLLAERGIRHAMPMRAALQPAMQGLQERLQPLRPTVVGARIAALELEVLARALSQPEASAESIENLSSALAAAGALQASLERLEAATESALQGFELLREVTIRGKSTMSVVELVDRADAIARPLTDQIGGVHWKVRVPDATVAMARPVVTSFVSTALATIAGIVRVRTIDGQMWGDVDRVADEICIELGSNRMRYGDGEVVHSALSRLGLESTAARLFIIGQAVRLVLPTAPSDPVLDTSG